MKRHFILFIPLLSILVGFFVLFELIPIIFPNSLMPSMHSIFIELDSYNKNLILSGLGATFIRFISATVIGYLVGITLSIPSIISYKIDLAISPWYNILRITPAIVWIPILLSFNSIDSNSIPIIISIIFSSLYVVLSISESIKNIPVEEKISMKAMKVSSKWQLYYCFIPRIIASSISGIKIGGSIALILVIVGEALLFLQPSLGYLITSYQTTMEKNGFWLTFIVLALLASVSFFLLNSLEVLFGLKTKKNG
ncbi:MAG: ABC transporter permease subunit [Prolixibacteraceae bacterium]|nr:ABC transporter permease subunit [Prolixibacteraceae bacterium]